MGNGTALEEMGSDGSLAGGHVRSGEPLSPVLQVRMGKGGMLAMWGGCLSLPGCTVCQGLAREDVSLEQNRHLLALWMCSALLGQMGCMRLAGSQPGRWGLAAHRCHRLSESSATVLLRWQQAT